MIKIFCLLVILANISLFMWEYRSGAFTGKKPEPPNANGLETIVLLDEMNSAKAALPPETNNKEASVSDDKNEQAKGSVKKSSIGN